MVRNRDHRPRIADLPVEVWQHDIRDHFDQVNDFDVILHAGGNPSAATSLTDPLGSVMDNVMGTARLLEYARKNTSRVVYYSSGEVFGPKPLGVESLPDDAYRSASPYAATKAGGEELCVAYSRSYGIPVSIFHINNTFGERIQADRFPAVVMRRVLADEPLVIHTGPTGEIGGRRWFHAEDVARHTEHVLDCQTTICEKWNTAGLAFINNLSFAKMIAESMGMPLDYRLEKTDRPGHDVSYNVDPTKLYDKGYREAYNTKQRVDQMVQWTLQNKEWL